MVISINFREEMEALIDQFPPDVIPEKPADGAPYSKFCNHRSERSIKQLFNDN